MGALYCVVSHLYSCSSSHPSVPLPSPPWKSKTSPIVKPSPLYERPYAASRIQALSAPLTRLGWATALIYVIDVFQIFLQGLSVLPWNFKGFSGFAASVLYGVWMCQVVCDAKRAVILRNFRGPRGQALLYNKIADFAINTGLAFFILEVFAVKFGVALKSFFAIGGVSTVVVGLACQGPMTQLVNGLILTLSDKIRPGDEVEFGDGSAGIVVSMDWFDLLLRGYNEHLIRIPNSEIATKRIHNIRGTLGGRSRPSSP